MGTSATVRLMQVSLHTWVKHTVECSQSSIERFVLRAAILHECQNYFGGGGGLGGSEKNMMKNMPDTFSIDYACLQINPFETVIL